MNLSVLLDPKQGGKVRLLITVLTAAMTILVAAGGTSSSLKWVASLTVGLTTLIGVLTHLTNIGNAA